MYFHNPSAWQPVRLVEQRLRIVMKVQFANGKIYDVADIDEAIKKCLANGDDPFNPVVLKEKPQEKKTKNADTVSE